LPFKKPEGSLSCLSCSHKSSIGPYPEPDECNPLPIQKKNRGWVAKNELCYEISTPRGNFGNEKIAVTQKEAFT
jgi:hypothetical protein